MPEEKRDYVMLRFDGLLVHTAPVTRKEAEWLALAAYYGIKSRKARIRYLEEWGNVLDVGDYMEQVDEEDISNYINYSIVGPYEGPDEFMKGMGRLLRRGDLRPRTRLALEGILDRAKEFLRKPVEPRFVDAPVRYYETSSFYFMHGPDFLNRFLNRGAPRISVADWYTQGFLRDTYWISVFKDSFWMWKEHDSAKIDIQAAIVRRDADDREVINAVLNDEAVQGFLKQYDEYFRRLIGENEAEMKERGFDDLVRKAKVVLTTADLLNAGRREEEGAPA